MNDKIKEARDYIEKYSRSYHAVILFDEAIKEARKEKIGNPYAKNRNRS